MSFRKPENAADLLGSILSSENGKVQKCLLERKRKEKEFIEKKENIKRKAIMAPKLNQMFVKNKNDEDKLISKTIGLRTVDEYKKIKDEIFNKTKSLQEDETVDQKENKKQKLFTLSFGLDDEEDYNENEEEEEEEEDLETTHVEKYNEEKEMEKKMERENEHIAEEIKKIKETKETKENEEKKNEDKIHRQLKEKEKPIFKKIMKDPTANTSFLKDKERDRQIELKKKELKELYYKLENEEKEKMIEITYSYYDGSGHRRKISVKKKTTIGQFINKCVDNLKNEFIQLRAASCETLMFVKEDLILPNYLTFYELIKNKAQGKTGPLFSFDVVEDLSGVTDIRQEKTDTHAGKLVEKRWYERNKHIFPASKWELYKPNKNYSTNYKDLFNNQS